jgi:hypothetical protein
MANMFGIKYKFKDNCDYKSFQWKISVCHIQEMHIDTSWMSQSTFHAYFLRHKGGSSHLVCCRKSLLRSLLCTIK